MSSQSLTHLVLLGLAAAGGGLAAQGPQQSATRLERPDDPLAAVRGAFNAAAGKPRFLAVLSPT